MKNRIGLDFAVLILVLALMLWKPFFYVTAQAESRIALIEDVNGDRIGVEPTSDEVWSKLVELYHNKDEMWIGGIVEVYLNIEPDPNYPWGFRFKPETIIVAEITAEGLQTTIRDISENLDYWLQLGHAYVFAKVVDYSIDSDLNDDGTVNIMDITIVAKAYGTTPEDQNWNPIADLDKNSIIDILDITKAAKDYGKTV